VSRNIPRGTGLNSVHKKHFSLRRDATSRVIRDEERNAEGEREKIPYPYATRRLHGAIDFSRVRQTARVLSYVIKRKYAAEM